MDKAPDAYRTISEVADHLDLPQHVLRFWETRFAQIRPLKRGGGRRYYRPEDIDLLKGIRHLLYGEGYTIRGVQRIIKESGVKSIQALGRGEGSAALPKPRGPEIIDPGTAADFGAPRREPVFGPPAPVPGGAAGAFDDDGPDRRDPDMDARPRDARDSGEPEAWDVEAEALEAEALEAEALEAYDEAAGPDGEAPHGEGAGSGHQAAAAPERWQRPEDREAGPPRPPAQQGPPGERGGRGGAPALAAEDIRRLRAALDALLACRRQLDQALEPR